MLKTIFQIKRERPSLQTLNFATLIPVRLRSRQCSETSFSYCSMASTDLKEFEPLDMLHLSAETKLFFLTLKSPSSTISILFSIMPIHASERKKISLLFLKISGVQENENRWLILKDSNRLLKNYSISFRKKILECKSVSSNLEGVLKDLSGWIFSFSSTLLNSTADRAPWGKRWYLRKMLWLGS